MNQVHISSDAVMNALADLLGPHGAGLQIAKPFRVALMPAHGRYAVGQSVRAPGVDDCSPRQAAEVLAVGTRRDYPGVWYLVRGKSSCQPLQALVRESDLQPEH